MTREEFISELNDRIKDNPDHNDIISYYFELISDKMDSGMDEEEAVDSLGSLDEIVKNIEGNKDDVEFKESFKGPESIIDINKESKEETKTENNNYQNTEPNNVKPEEKQLSGGRKFVYVLWNIATVLFCIASVFIFIVNIIGIGVGGALIAYGTLELAEISSFGLFFIGLGLFILGMSLAAIYYSNFLRRFMFENRLGWNKAIRDKLVGE